MRKLIFILCLALGFTGSFESLQATETYPSEYLAYYGEISSKTGRPKTKYVKGYRKKNGTYVKGYYRS